MTRPALKPLAAKPIQFRESLGSLQFVPRFFKEIIAVNPKLFYLNVLMRLFSAVLPLLMLWTGKLIIDEVILQLSLPSQNLTHLWTYTVIELAMAVLSDLLSRGISLTDGLLGDEYNIASSVRIIEKTSELSLGDLEDSEFYDKLERARQQTSNRVGLMSDILNQVQDVLIILSLLSGIVVFSPLLIVLLIVSIVPVIINELKFSGTGYSLARSWTSERRELDYLRYAGASDVTAKEVKLFGLAHYLAERFKHLAAKYYAASRTLALKRAGWGSLFNVAGTLAYYVAYAYILFRTVGGLFSLGDLTFLSGSFNRLRGKLQGFFTRFSSITERALYLQDYFEFLELTQKETSADQLRPLPRKILSGFQFSNVGFRYPGSDEWVVRNINFTLRAGEKLAFVGENGAGKTTLIKLLLRFYEPTEGNITLDGIDIKNFHSSEYQQYFGVIFQDFVKFELTLRENIAVGNINALHNDPLIKAAAEKSLAINVADEMPLGYEQQLGKRFKNGKDLSGGQWQKIALARAYMKDAQVLILDEPTSALDARAETEAFQRFIQLTIDKTAVIISHRFSTVRMADRIMVLQDGKVHEIGTHQELMQNNSLYKELFSLQAAGYL